MKTDILVLVSTFLIVTFAFCVAPAVASPPDRMNGQDWATRQYNKGKSGTCPVGTCSRIGTSFAKNLNACKASNCPNGGSK
jgi:hypothetical protein